MESSTSDHMISWWSGTTKVKQFTWFAGRPRSISKICVSVFDTDDLQGLAPDNIAYISNLKSRKSRKSKVHRLQKNIARIRNAFTGFLFLTPTNICIEIAYCIRKCHATIWRIGAQSSDFHHSEVWASLARMYEINGTNGARARLLHFCCTRCVPLCVGRTKTSHFRTWENTLSHVSMRCRVHYSPASGFAADSAPRCNRPAASERSSIEKYKHKHTLGHAHADHR